MPRSQEFDGACRGNPGVAGAGVVIYNSRWDEVGSIRFRFDYATSQQAETAALLLGLEVRMLLIRVDVFQPLWTGCQVGWHPHAERVW